MTLLEAHARIRRLPAAFFTTNDVASALGVESNYATKILGRLTKTNHIVRLGRGRWALPERVERFGLPEALTSPTPSYVSLHSALYHHALIEQLPAAIYAVTLGPTRRVRTPLGVVSLHHVVPRFFFGFEYTNSGAKVAVPEKALVDLLYFFPARSRRFRAYPEIELPRGFSRSKARAMVSAIGSPSRRVLVLSRLEAILSS